MSTPSFFSGVPLGGLGCGKIELCPDGAFRNITTHNNIDIPFSQVDSKPWPETVTASNRYTSEGLRNAFLFGSVQHEGGRLFKASEADFFDTTAAEDLRFQGLYPRAQIALPGLGGVELAVEAFSPLIPDNGAPKDSTLPAAIFLMRAENTGSTPKRASLGLSFPNIIGVGGYPNALIADMRANETNILSELDDAIALHYQHNQPKVDRRLNGEYIMMALKNTQAEVTWVVGSWNEALWKYVSAEARLTNSKSGMSLGEAGSVAPGTTGALCVSQTLQPGERFEIPVVLAWSFPEKPANAKPGIIYRNAYAKYFPDALTTARYALDHADRLHAATLGWQSFLLDSNLPEWLTYKLINNLFPMSSCSMYLEDSRFGINEAPTHMNGCMGTIDQRSACATPYVMLFPEIAKSELKQFADQQIGPDHPARHGEHWDAATGTFGRKLDRLGAIKHEIGWDELEEGHLGHKVWCNLHWPDLTAVFVLQCYQQIIWTGDENFLQESWPKIKLALEFHRRLDQNGDGLADLWGPGSSTFDNDQFPYFGASTFVATLDLAALKAAIKLAEYMGESDTARKFRSDFEKAQSTVERDLWNEKGYYNSWVDNQFENWKGGEREHDRVSENTMLSHLAGVWFARMLDLDPILDGNRVAQSLETLYQHNVRPNPYCAPNEVKPDGTNSWSWPYYGEVYYAANAIYQGQIDQGIEMVRKFYDAAFVKNTSHWDLPLSWEGSDNSKPWWGRWYMTNPSSWNVLLAITGIHYNALEESLTILPNPLAEMDALVRVPIFLPHFTGLLTARNDSLELKITQSSGVSLRRIEIPARLNGAVRMNDQILPVKTVEARPERKALLVKLDFQTGSRLVIR